MATLHGREGGVGGGRGLITSCPRFDVDVAEEGRRFRPFPASAIAFGDGGRSKGRTRKSNVACFKRLGHPWPQKFSTVGKKSRVNFHRPFTSVIPRRPSFPLRLSGLFFLPRMSIRFSATFFFLFSTKSSRSKIEESRIWVAKAFSYDKKGVDIFIICCRDETNNTRILNFFVWTNYRHLPVATKKIREYVYIYIYIYRLFRNEKPNEFDAHIHVPFDLYPHIKFLY